MEEEKRKERKRREETCVHLCAGVLTLLLFVQQWQVPAVTDPLARAVHTIVATESFVV